MERPLSATRRGAVSRIGPGTGDDSRRLRRRGPLPRRSFRSFLATSRRPLPPTSGEGLFAGERSGREAVRARSAVQPPRELSAEVGELASPEGARRGRLPPCTNGVLPAPPMPLMEARGWGGAPAVAGSRSPPTQKAGPGSGRSVRTGLYGSPPRRKNGKMRDLRRGAVTEKRMYSTWSPTCSTTKYTAVATRRPLRSRPSQYACFLPGSV